MRNLVSRVLEGHHEFEHGCVVLRRFIHQTSRTLDSVCCSGGKDSECELWSVTVQLQTNTTFVFKNLTLHKNDLAKTTFLKLSKVCFLTPIPPPTHLTLCEIYFQPILK